MVKPPAQKWVPKEYELIEVATSLSGARLKRQFVRMEHGKYLVHTLQHGEVAFRCAWPIKRMSGPDMTPVDPSPGMVILKGPSIGNIALPVAPVAAEFAPGDRVMASHLTRDDALFFAAIYVGKDNDRPVCHAKVDGFSLTFRQCRRPTPDELAKHWGVK
jgi:hypothetical protein